MSKKNPRKEELSLLKKYFVILIICHILLTSFFIINTSKSEEGKIAEWTFMVYMAGDNSLDVSDLQMPLDDINEMEIAGSTDDVNIIVLADRKSDDDNLYRINKDPTGYNPDDGSDENLDWDQPVSKELNDRGAVIPDDGELKMDDPQTLIDFLDWTVNNYPANHYLLDLWNHGQGWEWVCKDNNPSGELETSELDEALDTFKKTHKIKIDILGFDVCSLGFVEMFYQFKDYADICIASEEEWPEDGWAYNDFLQKLIIKPEMSPKELASIIVYDSVEAYRGVTDLPITHSAIDLNVINDVVISIDNFSKIIENSYPYFRNELKNIRSELASFRENAIDLYYFAKLIEKNGTRKLKISVKNIIDAIDNAVIAEDHWTENKDEAANNAHGISIYFPKYKAGFQDRYKNLNFAEDSGWDEFLEFYYNAQTETNANFKTINGEILDSNNDKIPDSIMIEYEVESKTKEVNVTIDIYDSKNNLVASFYDEFSTDENQRKKTFNNKNIGNDSYIACVYLRNENGLQDYREFEGFLEKCDIYISCEDNEQIIKPGDTTTYSINIKNNGNMDINPYDTVHLEYSELPKYWNASFDDDNDPETIFDNFTNVKTNSHKNITFNVESSDGTINGIYNITVFATSENGIEKSSLVVSTVISQRYSVNLTIEGAKKVIKKAKPGDNLDFTLTIVNEGNFKDIIALDRVGSNSNWAKFLITANSLELEPEESMEVNFSIKIPSDTKNGVYNFTVLANSLNSSSKDRVFLILEVEKKVIFGLEYTTFFLLVSIVISLLLLFIILILYPVVTKEGKKIDNKNLKINSIYKKGNKNNKTSITLKSYSKGGKKPK